MPALQVRELPDETYALLKTCAAESHRSIAQQTLAFIEESLARRGYGESSGAIARNACDGKTTAGTAFSLDDVPIPQNVRSASERARFVNPFNWESALAMEPDAVVAARKEKRRQLGEMIASIEWSDSAPALVEAPEALYESRDERADAIMANVESYLREREEAGR